MSSSNFPCDNTELRGGVSEELRGAGLSVSGAARTALSDFSKMARTGGHVPTVTVAPASASAFAIAQP